ncbi:MAG TPA: hypothetical protein VLW53_22050, partial [Candidatus Eisenbacteria bacterium]|nr:hypothetical protein [Candidatus Eisenbacteria bacterium]
GDRAFSGLAPAPHLSTVPTSVLARAGYSLAPAVTPPYCGVEQAAARHGLAPNGAAGCPISREAAMAAAPAAAQEALLARVTSSGSNPVGRDRLVWLVVYRPNVQLIPMIKCAAPATRPPCPPAPAPVLTSRSVIFLDAYTGRLLTFLPVTGAGSPATGAGSALPRVVPAMPLPAISTPPAVPAPGAPVASPAPVPTPG